MLATPPHGQHDINGATQTLMGYQRTEQVQTSHSLPPYNALPGNHI